MLIRFIRSLLSHVRAAGSREGQAGGESIVSENPGAVQVSSQPSAPLPLGARFRPQSEGYSMSLAQMEQVSEGIRQIPPLPQGALQVMRELDSENASAASVAQAIAREPVIAASVLRIANSAALGLRREITNVSEAVAYLGFSMTRSLFLRLKMSALMPSRPGIGVYDAEKLWAHAIAVASASEEVSRRAGGIDPQLALTAGLLHDIGKLAINSQHAPEAGRLWAEAVDVSESLPVREARLFGADHAFIGAALATEWGLPHTLVEIIRLHHLPVDQLSGLEPGLRRTLLAVLVANQLVKYRHVYCKEMEIDQVPAAVMQEMALPDWPELLADERLCDIIDRSILLNGGTRPTSVAA
jgi:putative nucleotidyltransferase with HDIG domain